jgi:carotenoid 1,2-hydratase
MDCAFDTPVPADGYRWWYLDALSDCGQHGLTLIAFVGSVFSPYYAWARQRTPGHTPAENYCAINVALYQKNAPRWALTERGSAQLRRTERTFHVGPSSLMWKSDGLHIAIKERCAPFPFKLDGEILVHGNFREDFQYSLDTQVHHHWGPIAPFASVTLDLKHPKVNWSGKAYFDSNAGSVPLEHDFIRWDWSRVVTPEGDTDVWYDIDLREGGATLLGERFYASGAVSSLLKAPEFSTDRQPLPTGPIWRVPRTTRLPHETTRIVRTLEDTPFYTRSMIHTQRAGIHSEGVHESLDLDRFSSRWVQMLLPFRMPRITRNGLW